MKKILSIYILVLTCLMASAQTPDRKTPPALGKAKNLQLPAVKKFTLSNGLPVVLMEKHAVPLVQINLQVNAGSFDDPSGKEGLSSFAMDLLDEGAGSLNSLQLADEIDFLGAQIGTFSRNFTSEINCNTPVAKLDGALKLMSDIALKPSFSENEIERVRELKLNSLLQAYDDAGTIAQCAINKFLFDSSTPYGKFENEQSIKSFTKNDLEIFHKTNFISGNSTLIIVGDVTKESIQPLLEKYFSTYPSGKITKLAKPTPQQIKGRTIYIVDKPGAAQSVIRIGKIGTSRSDADYNSIIVMNTILGGSFSSRLNNNLREQHGYSYGAGSGFNFWPMAGPFSASSSVQTDVTAPALGEFFIEFNRIRKPIPEEEFVRGRNYDALSFAGEFETNANIAAALGDQVFNNLPDSYFNSYVDKALAVTKKSVEAVAKKYITPENMLVVIVGDRAKIEEGVNKLNLGKITFLSIEDVIGKKP